MQPWLTKFIVGLPDFIFKPLANGMVKHVLNKYADIKVEGFENIEKANGPIIFICNHLSNSDALVISKILKEKYDPFFIAGVKLSGDDFTNIGMRLTKTINITPNSADKDALKNIIQTSKNGNNIFIFPEGTRSRTGEMIEAKKGINLIARLSKATVIPIGLSGTEKLMPINKDGEMGKETFHNAKVTVKIGEPIVIPKKEKEEDKHEYDDKVLRTYMKSIAALVPESYRGVYK